MYIYIYINIYICRYIHIYTLLSISLSLSLSLSLYIYIYIHLQQSLDGSVSMPPGRRLEATDVDSYSTHSFRKSAPSYSPASSEDNGPRALWRSSLITSTPP